MMWACQLSFHMSVCAYLGDESPMFSGTYHARICLLQFDAAWPHFWQRMHCVFFCRFASFLVYSDIYEFLSFIVVSVWLLSVITRWLCSGFIVVALLFILCTFCRLVFSPSRSVRICSVSASQYPLITNACVFPCVRVVVVIALVYKFQNFVVVIKFVCLFVLLLSCARYFYVKVF